MNETRELVRVSARLAAVPPEVADLAMDALSPSTWRAYRSAWRRWAASCAAGGVSPLPARPADLAAYLAQLVSSGCSYSSIRTAAAAVACVHRYTGSEVPTEAAVVRQVLRGASRRLGRAASREAAPLLVADLRAGIGGGGLVDVRDRALVLVGWAGALRRSELCGLLMGDIVRCDDGLVITIRRSKRDQEGEGARVGIPWAGDPAVCPVGAWSRWCAALASVAGSDALMPDCAAWRSIDRWSNVSADTLRPAAVTDIVRRWAARAGSDNHGAFSGHSLRAGFATEAARAGVPEWAIARQTRHASTATLRRYIRIGGLFRESPLSALL
uniref:Putative site-specific tyrosine recombinase n=1 Tax=viral metagenome TaxID=1070528 RepID=A0A6M3L539_9ZZZZ